ncbi:MAG: NADH-quinone oxidoreductase subunit B, partial [Halobacteriales archaeon]
MSSDAPTDATDDASPSTKTREARSGAGLDDRFNSKLREVFGASPFILTKFDKFMNWVRGS